MGLPDRPLPGSSGGCRLPKPQEDPVAPGPLSSWTAQWVARGKETRGVAGDPALPVSRPGVLSCQLAPRWQRRGLLRDMHTWVSSCLLIVPGFDISTQISWLTAQSPPLSSVCFNVSKAGFARPSPRGFISRPSAGDRGPSLTPPRPHLRRGGQQGTGTSAWPLQTDGGPFVYPLNKHPLRNR